MISLSLGQFRILLSDVPRLMIANPARSGYLMKRHHARQFL